jgi:hypothetical protein
MSEFSVTLKQLRENGACAAGYNKVVSALKGVEYDCNKKTYIRYIHDQAIPLAYIAETNGVDDALWCLRCNEQEWARDSRLFAVWCARQVQHLMTDQRSIDALDVAERFANGKASDSELAAALAAARDAARPTALGAAGAAMAAAWGATWGARVAAWGARDAAGDAQKVMFIKMCNGEASWQKENENE